jgi:hypothetical protein
VIVCINLCSVSFIVCVVLCAVFRLIVALFCVMCVISLLCLIVLPLTPGKNPFGVKINNSNNYMPYYVLKLCSVRQTPTFRVNILPLNLFYFLP